MQQQRISLPEDLMNPMNTTTPPAELRHSERFGRMMLVSLLVHGLLASGIMLSQGGRPHVPPAQYIDLQMSEPAKPPAPPTIPAELPQAAPAVHAKAASAEPAPEAVREPPPATPQPAPSKQDSFEQPSLGMGIVNGHFGSLSDGRTLRDDMREYYLSMLAKFNENWWREKSSEAGIGRGAVFVVVVARDGAITDITLLESTGNPSYDRRMVQALKTAGPLNPLPQSYEPALFSAPLRFVAPLNLMSPFSG